MPKHRNAGLWADRLSTSPREQAFADQWEEENERGTATGRVLAALLYRHGHGNESECGVPGSTCGRETLATGDVTLIARDRKVAATCMQWLGSNVGFSFLEEALLRAGYRIEKTSGAGRWVGR